MSKDLVSIITPVFNSSKYIGETIKSVLDQSYNNWEMIIVDDCSIDDSYKKIIKIIKGDHRFKVFQNNTNKGSGETRNFAIKMAKGRYISFLDSDDIWHKDKLKIQINLMDQNGWEFSHTSYGYLSADSQKIKSTFHVSDYPVSYSNLLKRTEISCLTATFDQSKIGKYYMSVHRRKQDYALWLDILKDGYNSYPIDIELAFYRQTPNSATSNKKKLIINHIKFLMETQSFSLIKAIYYTCFWMVNGFIRYYIK